MGKGDIKCMDTFFEDYTITKAIYHIAPIIKLEEILKNGLKLDEASSRKYKDFNSYFDSMKPLNIPEWVSRKKAIYGSMNFKSNHRWHSHSVILSIKIDEERCWVSDENLANILYEPFILSKIELFSSARQLLELKGKEYVANYWLNSISFVDNIKLRRDRKEWYDAEILIMHDIPPRDIKIVNIISDHRMMNVEEFNNTFKSQL